MKRARTYLRTSTSTVRCGGLSTSTRRITIALTIGPWIASDFIVIVLSETVLSETVLVLDGCLTCGDADRRSRRFARNCRPMGRIVTLDPFEYESSNKRLPITFLLGFRGAGLPGRRRAYRFFPTGSHVILYRMPCGQFGAGGGTETSRSRLLGT